MRCISNLVWKSGRANCETLLAAVKLSKATVFGLRAWSSPEAMAVRS